MTDVSLIMNLVGNELQTLFAKRKNNKGFNVFTIEKYHPDGFTFRFTNMKYRIKIEKEN